MSRAPFQVLVIPYILDENQAPMFAILKREDSKYWQGVAGGGDDQETPLEAARREAFEEAGIPFNSEFIALLSTTLMPVVNVSGFVWGEEIFMIPEYAFGVKVFSKEIKLSKEHLSYEWLDYKSAMSSLKWDSNHSALWELNYRITNPHINIKRNFSEIQKYFLHHCNSAQI